MARKPASSISAASGARSVSSSGPRARAASARSASAKRNGAKGAPISKRKAVDPDNPPLTKEQLKMLRPMPEAHKKLWAIAVSRGRGRPVSDTPKAQVTLRIDQDALEHFKASGPGWQSRINAALRKAAKLG